MKDFGILILAVFGVVIISAIFYFSFFGFWWATKPLEIQRETQASHQAYGYVTTQQNNLATLMSDYEKHQTEIDVLQSDSNTDNSNIIMDLQAQQHADLIKMRNAIKLMDKSNIPVDITQFLNEHSGE